MSSETLSATEHKMVRAVEVLGRDLQGIRTGRASTAIVDHILVEAYGSPMAINQLAGISVPEAHQIVITPWDRGALTEPPAGKAHDMKLPDGWKP